MAATPPPQTDGTLRASGVSVRFGALRAVDEVDLVVGPEEILGLIGPNGAGKTTLINALTGFQQLSAGRVSADGEDVTGRAPGPLVALGLGRTFQQVRLFDRLTVRENIEAAALGARAHRREAEALVGELLDRFELGRRAVDRAGSLPYGESRRLAVARALATRPRWLLLDEPAAGLNDSESDALAGTLREIRDDYGCALLVVEHDMRFIMGLCERIHVLDHGRTISIGRPSEVRADPLVLEAYLGTRSGTGGDFAGGR